ncbi:hypothetical protein B0H16DRAFT_1740340 [Mycena metata]|uniref:Uncharacterized protein n=1 Tax=Mycena metata TaxID=1033252 RepID=A0AAD7HDF4_9AGAR|nr:hypothetical protein B0H16DRAFT_1740340 [Mycena metata]
MTPVLLTPELKARLAEIKGGRIGLLTREPLLVLAEALGVSFEATGKNKTNVPDLKKRVTEALLNNPSLAMAEDFQKFVFYPRGTGASAVTKNSPDKASADSAQNTADQGPATGAHKKLLENVSNTAPPPQYRPLVVGTKAEVVMEKFANSDESRSTSSLGNAFDNIGGEDFGGEEAIDDILGEDVEGGNGDDGHMGDPATPINDEKGVAQAVKTRLEIDDIPIVVQFQGPERREVWIPKSQRSQISLIQAPDASGYFASLKQLLPVALAQDSPLKKDSKARLTIIGPLGARLKLGTVDQFDGENVPEALELNTVNQYKLKPIEGGLLCDVFYEPKDTSTEFSAHTSGGGGGGVVSDGASGLQNLLGPESKPLELAQQRAAARIAQDDEQDDPFVRFLRGILKGPAKKRPVLTKIKEMKARYRERIDATKDMKERWGDGANFLVPEDNTTGFAGYRFQTKQIQLALRINHTTAHNDDKLFRYTTLRDDHTGKAEAYVEEDQHAKLFDSMSVADWRKYFEDAKRDKERSDRREAEQEDRKRKRKEEKSAEKKEKKRRRARHSSEQLDEEGA